MTPWSRVFKREKKKVKNFKRTFIIDAVTNQRALGASSFTLFPIKISLFLMYANSNIKSICENQCMNTLER